MVSDGLVPECLGWMLGVHHHHQCEIYLSKLKAQFSSVAALLVGGVTMTVSLSYVREVPVAQYGFGVT